MKVTDLINHLSAYAAKSPENGKAEVMIQFFDDMCYGILGANDARGVVPGQHMLIIVPDVKERIGVRELKIQ